MPKGISKTGKRTLQAVECKICNSTLTHTGMNGHISKHKLTLEQYVEQYGEFRPHILKQKEKLYNCLECNKAFTSNRELSYHLRIQHSMTGREYALKHIFNNEPPKCGCGCGSLTTILPRPPWKRYYLAGHNPNGMTGRTHSIETRQILSKHSISRFYNTTKQDTSIERKFEGILIKLNIPYTKQVKTEVGVCDFFILDKYYVEIDGSYWHPLSLENLNIQHMASSIGDYRKNNTLSNLIRLRQEDIDKIYTLEDIFTFNSKERYPTKISNYSTCIIHKSYFKSLEGKQKDYFKSNVYLLLKFLRTYQPHFPTIETKEKLDEILQKIPKKINGVFNPETLTFNNHCSSLGVSYLKSTFDSYWKSKYKNGKSPIEMWQDDKLMLSIIKYRTGLNTTGEVFDFSVKEMIRGISALRGCISFFKPVLAGAIYKYYLQDMKSPTVLDPCGGFGGRMLGFKSLYPAGKYIALEPNVETYQELIKLKNKICSDDSIEVLNITFEEYQKYNESYDLIFTSIPYFDLEVYSSTVQYRDFEDWKERFINEFYRYSSKVVLNIPPSLLECFKSPSSTLYLKHNASHLSNQDFKYEYIINL